MMRVGNFHTPSANRLRLCLSYLSMYLTTYQMLLWTLGNRLLQSSPRTPNQTPALSFHTPALSFVSERVDNHLAITSDMSDAIVLHIENVGLRTDDAVMKDSSSISGNSNQGGSVNA